MIIVVVMLAVTACWVAYTFLTDRRDYRKKDEDQ